MKSDLKLIILSTAFVLLFASVSRVLVVKTPPALTEEMTGSWACAADFYVCPDGTEVWRTPPYCLFAACPR